MEANLKSNAQTIDLSAASCHGFKQSTGKIRNVIASSGTALAILSALSSPTGLGAESDGAPSKGDRSTIHYPQGNAYLCALQDEMHRLIGDYPIREDPDPQRPGAMRPTVHVFNWARQFAAESLPSTWIYAIEHFGNWCSADINWKQFEALKQISVVLTPDPSRGAVQTQVLGRALTNENADLSEHLLKLENVRLAITNSTEDIASMEKSADRQAAILLTTIFPQLLRLAQIQDEEHLVLMQINALNENDFLYQSMVLHKVQAALTSQGVNSRIRSTPEFALYRRERFISGSFDHELLVGNRFSVVEPGKDPQPVLELEVDVPISLTH